MCASHGLVITNTMFRLSNRSKTTWMNPHSRHWHLIDHVITRAKGRRGVRVTKAMCGADCWTNHCLIILKLNFSIRARRSPQGKKVPRRLNVHKFECPDIVKKFQLNMDNKLENLQLTLESVEEKWVSFRDAVHSAALETLGPATRHHQDWW